MCNHTKWLSGKSIRKITSKSERVRWSPQTYISLPLHSLIDIACVASHFRLVSEQRKTEEFWPREERNESRKSAPFFSSYLTLAPRALLRNRTETLATHAMIDSSLMLTVAMPLSFCVLRVASRVFFFSDKRSSYCAKGLFHEKRENAREDGEEVRKKGRKTYGSGTCLSLPLRSPRTCSQGSLCYILNEIVIITLKWLKQKPQLSLHRPKKGFSLARPQTFSLTVPPRGWW